MKKNKYIYGIIAATTAITLATVGASTVSADTQYGIFLNRVTGEWQTVNHATGEIVKSEPNGTYSTYDEANAGLSSWLETQASTVETPVTTEAPAAETTAVETPKTAADVKPALDAQTQVVSDVEGQVATAQDAATKADQAQATAQADVDTATQAVKDAKKADADRDAKIKAAETEVAVKSDAVDTAKAKLTAAQDESKTTTDALNKTNDAVKTATDALANVDTVTIADLTQFKADKASGDSDFMTDSGATVIEQSTVSISKDSKSVLVDIDNLTNEQKISASQLYVQGLTQIRQALNGLTSTAVTQAAIDLAQLRADQYEARGTNPLTDGHIGAGVENLIRLGSKSTIQTEEDLKRAVYNALLGTSFADAPSNWGHLRANLNFANNIGIAIANINGDYWLVVAFTNEGTPIANPNDPATLQAALAKAQADQSAAQAASDTAQANLVKASSDYAKALELKTQAEKTLADATATPLQTQVAENNLRLATIALQNAEARKADAQKAVDNFSADLATKKAALDTAKTELAQAQATATAKAETLETAKAELVKQQGTLDSLNKDKDALLAEKDRLVEEAKALATELKGYLEAPAILANAQATLTEKQAALTEAQAKAETAQNKLETVTAKLAAEESKLAELQAEYDKIKDLEDKAKDNVIATLPDGTIVAVPKDAPTAVEKPAINIDAVKDAITKGQDVRVVDGKVVVTNPQAGVTVTPQGITYSRVDRAKTLPNTGEQTSLLALAGVAVLSSLGLASARRRKQG
ncbi:SEC10/PgrA surface exclusion domain-containing protein [Streptococcus suis]|uniref:SEC10/PgrA surface exclusion domain-containing protein n=1 Tax=Streptococcus suis TaxID=1307 RepID=UPI002AB460A2|nr:SEC10/PgrA surface exclusion domain-containing protein [Streptococcus suis]MDY7593719.1 SEC10/PgrA surface exclusion domain-containing protein [Streptococcus suis]